VDPRQDASRPLFRRELLMTLKDSRLGVDTPLITHQFLCVPVPLLLTTAALLMNQHHAYSMERHRR
jgi:hypothetical protein